MKVEVVNPDEEIDSAKDAAADPTSQVSQAAAAQENNQAAAPDPEVAASGKADRAADAQGYAEDASEEALEPEVSVIDEEEDTATSQAQEPIEDPVADDNEVFSLDDLKKARQAAKDANDRYMRLEAEWDNYRKRVAREREQERSRAAEKLVTSLLPVMDDIERALAHAATQAPEGAFSQFVDGIEAVHTKFASVLEKSGVEVIDPAGKPFDMNEHQAVGHVEDADAYDETVRDVYQKGYRMGGRVIRPAMVTITKGGPRRPANPANDATCEQDA